MPKETQTGHGFYSETVRKPPEQQKELVAPRAVASTDAAPGAPRVSGFVFPSEGPRPSRELWLRHNHAGRGRDGPCRLCWAFLRGRLRVFSAAG